MRSTTGAALALSAVLLAGCGGGTDEDRDDGDDGASGEPRPRSTEATFMPRSSAGAITYDEDAVPDGATIELQHAAERGDGTEFALTVTGLRSDRDYGAHVHTKPCGAKPDDSGPHYQHKPDPEQPSSNPEYANDDNEVWLDFRTSAEGDATADTDVDWVPRKGEANSVVLHAEHTRTDAGHAGMAGDRLACIDVEL